MSREPSAHQFLDGNDNLKINSNGSGNEGNGINSSRNFNTSTNNINEINASVTSNSICNNSNCNDNNNSNNGISTKEQNKIGLGQIHTQYGNRFKGDYLDNIITTTKQKDSVNMDMRNEAIFPNAKISTDDIYCTEFLPAEKMDKKICGVTADSGALAGVSTNSIVLTPTIDIYSSGGGHGNNFVQTVISSNGTHNNLLVGSAVIDPMSNGKKLEDYKPRFDSSSAHLDYNNTNIGLSIVPAQQIIQSSKAMSRNDSMLIQNAAGSDQNVRNPKDSNDASLSIGLKNEMVNLNLNPSDTLGVQLMDSQRLQIINSNTKGKVDNDSDELRNRERDASQNTNNIYYNQNYAATGGGVNNNGDNLVSIPYFECNYGKGTHGLDKIVSIGLKNVSIATKTYTSFINVVKESNIFGVNAEVSIPSFSTRNIDTYFYKKKLAVNYGKQLQSNMISSRSCNDFEQAVQQRSQLSQMTKSNSTVSVGVMTPGASIFGNQSQMEGRQFVVGGQTLQQPIPMLHRVESTGNSMPNSARQQFIPNTHSAGSLTESSHTNFYPGTQQGSRSHSMFFEQSQPIIPSQRIDNSAHFTGSRVNSSHNIQQIGTFIGNSNNSIANQQGENTNFIISNNGAQQQNGQIHSGINATMLKEQKIFATQQQNQNQNDPQQQQQAYAANQTQLPMHTQEQLDAANTIDISANIAKEQQPPQQQGTAAEQDVSFGSFVNVLPQITHDQPTAKPHTTGTRSLMKNFRSSTKFTDEQTLILIQAFSKNPRPSQTEIATLAQRSNLKVQQIKVWYQNKRSRYINKKLGKDLKKKQESDVTEKENELRNDIEFQEEN